MNLVLAGAVFGLSGGLSPGPLLALVISEALNHGVWAGIRVAVAPLLTDLPIVGAVLLLLVRLSNADTVLGVIALAGAVFLVILGAKSLAFRGTEVEVAEVRPRSLAKGVATNFLNPSPYLFWLTIGGPTVVRAAAQGSTAVVAFIASFYFMLVGSKVIISILVSRSRQLLRSTTYVWLNRALGVALLAFAVHFLRDGVAYLTG